MSGRTLAFGDVHGCYRALSRLLKLVAVSPADTLVFLGDLVDRGPGTKQVIDALIRLRQSCKLVLIMGNHEEMMRDAISGHGLFNAWLDQGGRQTLSSYGGSIENIPLSHLKFLLSAQAFWEAEADIFVHACLEPNVSLANQTADYLRWKHLGGGEAPHSSGKRVICGHTPQRDGVPLVLDGWVCIDTFAHGGGYLSCLDVGSNHVFQASESGTHREFPLARYA
jgi:serine/threonine protein phosphatase 1